jgi:transposase
MANIRAPNMVCDDKMRDLVIHSALVRNLRSVDIAANFLISKRTVDRILQRYRESGQAHKKKHGGYKPKL